MEFVKFILDICSSLATIAGGIAIIYAVNAYRLNKKQLNFSVLDRCISIFQEKFTSLSNDSEVSLIKAYIDLVNEELFYFEQMYIPKEVAYEWIDGMIDYIPIYDSSKNILNPENSILPIHEQNLLNQFQRVKRAFIVKGKYDPKIIFSDFNDEARYQERRQQRERLAKEIYQNVKKRTIN